MEQQERDPHDGPGDTPDRPDIWVDGPVAIPGDGQPVNEGREGDRHFLDFAQDADENSEIVDVSQEANDAPVDAGDPPNNEPPPGID